MGAFFLCYPRRCRKERKNLVACSGGRDIADPYYVLNNFTQLEELAEVLVKKFKKEGVKKIVYAITPNLSSESQIEIVGKALKEADIEILSLERFNAGTKDFRLAISKAEQLNPDYYLVYMHNPDTSIFIKQHRSITGKDNITSIDSFHEMSSSDWGLVEGLWFVKSALGTVDFINKFKETTSKDGISCTGNLYDNLDLIIWAYENTPLRDGKIIPDNKDVVETLHGIKDREGAIGKFSIDDKGIVRSKASLATIKDGKIIDIKE